MHSIALDIFDFCRNFNVRFVSQWVPRELNTCADDIGNIIDFDDWYTTQGFFAHLDHIWGPHTVDRFANALNAHLSRFNSKFRVPGTEAVDAFSVSWAAENNWLVPPVHCIARVIQHLFVCSAFGTFGTFWPFLFASSLDCQPYIVDSIYYPDLSGIFAL